MSYRAYNTRNSNSGRYNNSGQFVSAGEMSQQVPYTPQPLGGVADYNNGPRVSYTPNQTRVVDLQQQQQTPDDMDMQQDEPVDCQKTDHPAWMTSKLQGVKKLSKKERRRRQNNNLRRLITPKNALMVLNEMIPTENIAASFKVEPFPNKMNTFCADLDVNGVTYKGFGENKLMARNAAAEQAIRDLILRKMNKAFSDDTSVSSDTDTGEPVPMLQLASFALHKLFTEWQYDGHKMARQNSQSQSIKNESDAGAAAAPAKPAKPPRALPANAAQLHPCMLLTYMRPAAAYRDLDPHPAPMAANVQQLFTIEIDVDGQVWSATAANKKEARRLAAKSACEALFSVQFDAAPSSNVPQPPA